MTEWNLDFEGDEEVYRCSTCGNDACSACGGSLIGGFTHVFWHEDVCRKCQGLDSLEDDAHIE